MTVTRKQRRRSSSAVLTLAKEAHQAGRVTVAEDLYKQVCEQVPADAVEGHRCLGILYTQQGRLDAAIGQMTTAIRLSHGDAALLNDLGTIYQRANRLGDAIAAYREAAALQPESAIVQLHLGSALHQQGMLNEAVESYHRALGIDPMTAHAHLNLGVALQQLGHHREAEAAFGEALAIDPHSSAACFNLGISLVAQDRTDEAIQAYRAALRIDSNVAAVHVNLGMVLERKHELDAAIACYKRAIELDPLLVVAFNNLGCALRGQRRFKEAVEAHRRALVIDPTAVLAYVDLGAALEGLRQLDEAILSYRSAIALDASSALAHSALAVVLRDKGLLEEAFASFRTHAALVFGARRPRVEPPPPYRTKHDREQLQYLIETRILEDSPSLLALADDRREAAEQFDERFSTLFHIEGGDRCASPAINSRGDGAEIERVWEQSSPNIVVVDDLLSPEALGELKRFCWGSTIWRGEYRLGYLGAMPESGFAVPLLAQISGELTAAFPRIFRDHPLLQWWAFKYDSELSGIGIHADFAAINVNFWITPDEANLDPACGGLVIWDKPAPLDWTFEKYNNVETAEIRKFLSEAGAKSVAIPYRANRAVIFDSDLFHETDRIAFKEGYRNRRINVTLLYGLREHTGTAPHREPRS
jgi:tetratricopeptide (TPR) repeat protein